MEPSNLLPAFLLYCTSMLATHEWYPVRVLLAKGEGRAACHFMDSDSTNHSQFVFPYISIITLASSPTTELGTLPIWISAVLIVAACLLIFFAAEPRRKKAILLNVGGSSDLPAALSGWIRVKRWSAGLIFGAFLASVWNLYVALTANVASA